MKSIARARGGRRRSSTASTNRPRRWRSAPVRHRRRWRSASRRARARSTRTTCRSRSSSRSNRVAARRAQEGAGRIPPEGSLRRARVQRHAPGARPQRRHHCLREGQGQEQGRPGAGHLEAGRPRRQGRRPDEGRQPDLRGHAGPRHYLRRRRCRKTALDKPELTIDDQVKRRQARGERDVRHVRRRHLRRPGRRAWRREDRGRRRSTTSSRPSRRSK